MPTEGKFYHADDKFQQTFHKLLLIYSKHVCVIVIHVDFCCAVLAVDKAMPEQIKQFEEEVRKHVEEESGQR